MGFMFRCVVLCVDICRVFRCLCRWVWGFCLWVCLFARCVSLVSCGVGGLSVAPTFVIYVAASFLIHMSSLFVVWVCEHIVTQRMKNIYTPTPNEKEIYLRFYLCHLLRHLLRWGGGCLQTYNNITKQKRTTHYDIIQQTSQTTIDVNRRRK